MAKNDRYFKKGKEFRAATSAADAVSLDFNGWQEVSEEDYQAALTAAIEAEKPTSGGTVVAPKASTSTTSTTGTTGTTSTSTTAKS